MEVKDYKLTDAGNPRRLLGSSHKVELGEGYGYLTRVLYLAASDRSGTNVCPFADRCRALCLGHTSGHMVMNRVQRAQLARTRWLLDDRESFLAQLEHEVKLHARNAARKGKLPAVRLNGTSDLVWPRIHQGVQQYEYTKRPPTRSALRMRQEGIHLTYSLDSLERLEVAKAWQDHGVNVAVVVRSKAQARALLDAGEWRGRPTIDGDRHDLRFLDPALGGWVVLYAKGKPAREDRSGFVQDVE